MNYKLQEPSPPTDLPRAGCRQHGNPNVLTLDIGTSPLAQGTSALTALIEIEHWDAPAPPLRAFTPPRLAAAG
jgi:biotin/methionine sulfoxide reductase